MDKLKNGCWCLIRWWINGWRDKKKNEGIIWYEWTDEWMVVVFFHVEGWRDEWKNWWKNERMKGWKDERIKG